MKITGFDVQEKEINFAQLSRIMSDLSFIHEGQWDYERVTFDVKMLDATDEATYFLRQQAVAISGEIPKDNAVVKLLTPVLGRHYYPHGVEYDEEFPEKIVAKCESKLKQLEGELNELGV
ncbi:YugN-like protein [Salsuginibacillus halophilus]|uniref:YugN-like protein n=1 Tax=Salsuginibacillus halophilus TaxID=517424 RepID=A0A2P8HX70_9BACI|nr:YugN family protein [Salsuginibacillus halophilus]PSL50820.1 YugN-like protein [Salsuginibacillus halophilus]